jgi:16S rRNA (guanine966-N2)-methyltransferase
VRVLDGFAGTGALGLEALSRGAAAAWFIEKDRAALAALRANVASCGAGRVLAADMLRPPPGQPCGLVFLDPPYGRGLLPLAVAALRQAGWLAPGAILVAEAAADESPALGELLAERRHGAGRVTVWSVADQP